jgi:hypothetical protein
MKDVYCIDCQKLNCANATTLKTGFTQFRGMKVNVGYHAAQDQKKMTS